MNRASAALAALACACLAAAGAAAMAPLPIQPPPVSPPPSPGAGAFAPIPPSWLQRQQKDARITADCRKIYADFLAERKKSDERQVGAVSAVVSGGTPNAGAIYNAAKAGAREAQENRAYIRTLECELIKANARLEYLTEALVAMQPSLAGPNP